MESTIVFLQELRSQAQRTIAELTAERGDNEPTVAQTLAYGIAVGSFATANTALIGLGYESADE